jgi:PelA/Pel-15E family pectate lyase
MRHGAVGPLLAGLLLGLAACGAAVWGGAPVAAAPVPPHPEPEGALLAPERIAALPAAERAAWTRYLETSERLRERDRALIDAELAALGQRRWTPAREARPLVVTDEMDAAWFGGEEARRIAESILSFQTPAGGWSKSVDLRAGPRRPGESFGVSDGWSYIGTFDNDATTEQLRFLDGAWRAHGDERYRSAFVRGLEYVLLAQYPNGCWPQVYPLQGGYHDAVTYNDDAMVLTLRLLREAADGTLPAAPEPLRLRAAESLRRGVGCVVASQVVVDGRLTVWGQQHDPLGLRPVSARAYEHASLSGGESVQLLDFLMQVEAPDAAVGGGVHAGAAWFRETAIHGFDYEPKGRLVARPGAGPIWARFYEIGTDRPIFSNRDGVVRYHIHELDEERRTGYAWYRDSASSMLRRYDRWAVRHPAIP